MQFNIILLFLKVHEHLLLNQCFIFLFFHFISDSSPCLPVSGDGNAFLDNTEGESALCLFSKYWFSKTVS